MASPSLALPGVVFVGEDERSRIVVHLGPAAGWMIPKGILGWSTEVSVVTRDALTEDVRREAKIVMPDEQVPPARMPLTHQALRNTPLIAVSAKLVPKLVERGVRVHTIGADRVTSSFYYIGEGGDEEPVRVEGDLVAAVGAMLGERADNAAIERVLDGLLDRLLRSLSRDRVTELSIELAAALPRAAADGSGTQDVDLESFEKELSRLVGASEKHSAPLREIGERVAGTPERRLDIPLFGEVRKVSQGPFELVVGERKVSLATSERWIASGPFSDAPPKAAPAPAVAARSVPAAVAPAAVAAAPVAAAPSPRPAPVAAPSPRPAPGVAAAAPKVVESTRSPAPAPVSSQPNSPPSSMKPLSAPLTPPRPASNPPPRMRAESRPAADEVKSVPALAVGPPVSPTEVKVIEPDPPKIQEPKIQEKVEAAPEPEPAPKVEPAAVELTAAPTMESAKVESVKVQAATSKVEEEPSSSEPSEPAEPTEQETKPVAKAKPANTKKGDEEERDATTRKIQRPEKTKGFPWILLVVVAAALFAGYRFLLAK